MSQSTAQFSPEEKSDIHYLARSLSATYTVKVQHNNVFRVNFQLIYSDEDQKANFVPRPNNPQFLTEHNHTKPDKTLA